MGSDFTAGVVISGSEKYGLPASHAALINEIADCRALLRDCRSLLEAIADGDYESGETIRQIHNMQVRIDKQVK